MKFLTKDEHDAQEALYGLQTRSGQVWLTPLRPGRDGIAAGFPRERELWTDWDEVVWFPVGRSISARGFNSAHEQIYAGMILESLVLAKQIREQGN